MTTGLFGNENRDSFAQVPLIFSFTHDLSDDSPLLDSSKYNLCHMTPPSGNLNLIGFHGHAPREVVGLPRIADFAVFLSRNRGDHAGP